jgi:hypothetical protein
MEFVMVSLHPLNTRCCAICKPPPSTPKEAGLAIFMNMLSALEEKDYSNLSFIPFCGGHHTQHVTPGTPINSLTSQLTQTSFHAYCTERKRLQEEVRFRETVLLQLDSE